MKNTEELEDGEYFSINVFNNVNVGRRFNHNGIKGIFYFSPQLSYAWDEFKHSHAIDVTPIDYPTFVSLLTQNLINSLEQGATIDACCINESPKPIKQLEIGQLFLQENGIPGCRFDMRPERLATIQGVIYFDPNNPNHWESLETVKDEIVTPCDYQSFVTALIQQVIK